MHIIYAETTSPFIMSLIPVTITGVRFLSSLIVPLLFQRVTLTHLLAIAQGTKVVLMLALLWAVPFAPVPVWFIVIGLLASFDAWADPCSYTLIPRIVDPSKRVAANSKAAVVNETTEMGCWALGGVLLAMTHSQLVLLIVLTVYTIATVCFFILMRRLPDVFANEEGSTESFFAPLKKGWVTILQTRWLRHTTGISFFSSIISVIWIAAILYVFTEEVLAVSEAWWGMLNASLFIGLMVAGVLLQRYDQFVQHHLARIVFVGFLGSAILTLLFSINTVPVVALIVMIGLGWFLQLENVGTQTIYQAKVEEGLFANVYAAEHALSMLAFGVGSLLVGIISELVDIRLLYLAGAFTLFAVAFWWRYTFPGK
ncbi:macrolide efflux protein [Geomicrobium sp. JCM 19039]|nr:macrolide efflux protein [Geomicrobium sp. JCM 19039]